MVRQAYIHRLALGRSAFEAPAASRNNDLQEPSTQGEPDTSEYVQEFNSRGNPVDSASRTQARRTIRAYNEVLEVVDVCARVDSNGKDILRRRLNTHFTIDQINSVNEENETGFWLGVVHDVTCHTAASVTFNLHRRIMTFDFYKGIPLLTIFRTELRRQGFWQVFLAGEFASAVHFLLLSSIHAFIETGSELLQEYIIRRTKRRTWNSLLRIVNGTERLLKYATTWALFPLQFFAGLQRLGLIPVWPLLPNPFSRAYFQFGFPSVPRTRSLNAFVTWGIALTLSPAVVFMGMHYVGDRIHEKVHYYFKESMPRPDNPDSLSRKIEEDPEFGDMAPVTRFQDFRSDLRTLLWKDIEKLLDSISEKHSRWRRSLRKFLRPRRPTVDFPIPPALEQHTMTLYEPSPDAAPRARDQQTMTEPPHVPENSAESSSTVLDEGTLSPTSSQEDNDIGLSNTSNVRIRTRSGSTSTIHMDVEFNTSDRAPGPAHTSSFAASPHYPAPVTSSSTRIFPHPRHRVTALSLFPVDNLSHHLAQAVVMAARMPMESIYTRSLSTVFLGARDRPSFLLQRIIPVGSWFGSSNGSGRNIWDYAGKNLLCLGLETTMMIQIWSLACQGALWFGKNWFGWSHL